MQEQQCTLGEAERMHLDALPHKGLCHTLSLQGDAGMSLAGPCRAWAAHENLDHMNSQANSLGGLKAALSHAGVVFGSVVR